MLGFPPMVSKTRQSLRQLGHQGVGVARSLGLNVVWNKVSALLPAEVQRRVKKLSARSRYGTPLVPAEALQKCYANAIQLLRDRRSVAVLGDYLEFGVCHGTSMLCMHRALTDAGVDTVRLFGFDSFEGLPEVAATDDEGAWPPGSFDSDLGYTTQLLTNGGVDWSRAFLVQGWFRDTLNEGLIRKHNIDKAGLIMIDSDIYTSAKEALDFCAPLIKDQSVVFFDDWNSAGLADRNLGEKKAFDEFLAEHPEFTAEPLAPYSEGSAVFLVTRRA